MCEARCARSQRALVAYLPAGSTPAHGVCAIERKKGSSERIQEGVRWKLASKGGGLLYQKNGGRHASL
eukprot:1157325-Pelagomonas_calceolata.AAC.14